LSLIKTHSPTFGSQSRLLHSIQRPAIVVGGANGLTVVVPCTTPIITARFSHTYSISPSSHNGLDAESIARVFKIVALDRDQFRHQIGAISEQQRLAIVRADAGPAKTGLNLFFSFHQLQSLRLAPGFLY